jgi:glucose-1-phosphate adenylyltransferase
MRKMLPDLGILKSDEQNNITAFIEKPGKDILPQWSSDVDEVSKAQGKNYLASMGIYIFTKSILAKYLMKIKEMTLVKKLYLHQLAITIH